MILSHLILNIRIYLVMQYLLFQLFLVIFLVKTTNKSTRTPRMSICQADRFSAEKSFLRYAFRFFFNLHFYIYKFDVWSYKKSYVIPYWHVYYLVKIFCWFLFHECLFFGLLLRLIFRYKCQPILAIFSKIKSQSSHFWWIWGFFYLWILIEKWSFWLKRGANHFQTKNGPWDNNFCHFYQKKPV